MDTGLTTIPEADIEKHRATAQSMITRIVVLEDSSRPVRHRARRHRPPLRLDGFDRLGAQDARGRADEDRRLDPPRRPADVDRPAHAALSRAARHRVALAVSDVFARSGDLESLQAKNARAPLEGDEATHFKKLLSASAYVSAFASPPTCCS